MTSTSTSYKTACIEQVYFLRWLTPPRPGDPPALLDEMRGISQKLGKKMFVVSVIASNTPVPNSEQRKLLNGLVADVRQYASEVFMVVEGNELQHNLQRVIISGTLIFSRVNAGYLSVYKSADQLQGILTERLGKDAGYIVKDARQRGLVT